MLSLLPYLTSILRAPLNSTEWKLLPLYPQELLGINSPNSSGLNRPSRVSQYLSVPTFTTKREGGRAFEKKLTRPCKDQGTEFWPCLFSHEGWEGVGGGRTCKASFSQCQSVSLSAPAYVPWWQEATTLTELQFWTSAVPKVLYQAFPSAYYYSLKLKRKFLYQLEEEKHYISVPWAEFSADKHEHMVESREVSHRQAVLPMVVSIFIKSNSQ